MSSKRLRELLFQLIRFQFDWMTPLENILYKRLIQAPLFFSTWGFGIFDLDKAGWFRHSESKP